MEKMKLSLLSCALTFATMLPAHATSCHSSTIVGHIGDIQYSVKKYYPTFTIREYAKSDHDPWMNLGMDQGENTYYGRSLLAITLTAKATNAKVSVSCSSSGNVDGITILDE